jgi:hypothetical protein
MNIIECSGICSRESNKAINLASSRLEIDIAKVEIASQAKTEQSIYPNVILAEEHLRDCLKKTHVYDPIYSYNTSNSIF